MKELTRVNGVLFNSDRLPTFLSAKELVEKLTDKGFRMDLTKVCELVESNKLPCFFFDDDRSNPLFLWADVQEWITQKMIWRQEGAAMSVNVINVSPDIAKHATKVPSGLIGVEQLYELSPHDQPVVYFLLRRGIIVYVGQSRCLTNRVRQHRDDKTFDRILYLNVPGSQMDEIERQYIEALRPEYNREYNQPMKAEALTPAA